MIFPGEKIKQNTINERNHKVRINKIAIEHQISDHLVEQVVEDYMEWVFDKMQDEEYYPNVKVPFFGTFGVNYKKLRNKILAKIRRYKRGKEERETVVEYVKKYRPLYRRLVEYKFSQLRFYKFDGKKLKRKIPLGWQAKRWPEKWPELDLEEE